MKSRDIWPRAVLLAVWGAAADLWLSRHLGFGLSNPVQLLGLTSALTVGSFVLDWFVQKDEKEKVQQRWSTRLRDSLGQPWTTYLLVLLYLGGATLAATCSSFIVIGASKGAAIVDLDGNSIGEIKAGAASPSRLLIATNPFGRDLRIAVPGFVVKTVTLYPLFGQTIDPDHDLQPLPTLVFRPTTEALDSLGVGGTFSVFKIDGEACKMIGRSGSTASRRGFLVGKQQSMPPGNLALWSLELGAAGLKDKDLADALLAWSQPEVVTTTEPIEPGARIYAVVTTAQAGKRKAEALATVGREALQDIRMHAEAATPPCRMAD